jgi:thiol-disulfide isomerase/thioredoxin
MKLPSLMLMSALFLFTLPGATFSKDSAAIAKNEVILFMRPSCPYSTYLIPLFNKLTQECASLPIVFKTIDITGAEQYKKQYGFRTVPTVIYFKNGKAQFSHGSDTKKMTTAKMRAHIKKIYGL